MSAKEEVAEARYRARLVETYAAGAEDIANPAAVRAEHHNNAQWWANATHRRARYGEYTPDPGDVSVFEWEMKP